jgi:hypothetical protein
LLRAQQRRCLAVVERHEPHEPDNTTTSAPELASAATVTTIVSGAALRRAISQQAAVPLFGKHAHSHMFEERVDKRDEPQPVERRNTTPLLLDKAGDGNTVLLSSAGHERQKDLVRGWPATRAATTTSATIASHRCSVKDVSCCFGQASTRTMMPLHCRTRRHGAGVTAGADVTAWR